jgi:hypothetical protein
VLRRCLTTMLGLVPLALGFAATGASALEADLDTAWRDYAGNRAHLEPAYRFPHATCFATAALQYDLPETLLLAVARGESDFEATARSRANAHGVMQILWPDTARHLGIYRLSELYDPCTNIDAGARYLKELLARYDGNLHLALAAYNYGPRRIPVDGGAIPSGANWYSGYILRHLHYVLGDGKAVKPVGDALYSELGQSTLVTFGEPYRAEAFVERLEQQAPDLNLDWFRRGTGEFEVVMTYADRQEFDASARLLRNAGFRIE